MTEAASVLAATLLAEARALMSRPDAATTGIWPRASALLARQALETAVRDLWRAKVPQLEQCSFRVQFLCLPTAIDDAALAAQIRYTWCALSHACHHRGYDLAPTATELARWMDDVAGLLDSMAGTRA